MSELFEEVAPPPDVEDREVLFWLLLDESEDEFVLELFGESLNVVVTAGEEDVVTSICLLLIDFAESGSWPDSKFALPSPLSTLVGEPNSTTPDAELCS